MHLKELIRKNRGPLAALLSGCLAVALFRLARNSRGLMNWFVTYISAPWKRFFGAVAEWFPFSLAELLVTLLVLGVSVWLLVTLYQKFVLRRPVLLHRLLALLALPVWIYAGFCATWGVQYYADSFSERSGLGGQLVSVEQLEATARWFAEGASRSAELVERDEQGRFLGSTERILAYGDRSYEKIVQEWPFLDGPHRTPKPAFYSRIMSHAGFTGYLFPFLGESTLNVDCPNVYLPVTVAHEMAHQRGVAPEQEANFLGIAACLSCPDPEYQYSGWLFGFVHLSNALYSADPAAWERVQASLSDACRVDLAWNSLYWKQFESPVQDAVQNGYSGFLQGYGQTLGLKSYGACVDLLVAYYGPEIS